MMGKVISLLKAAPGRDPTAFADWYAATVATALFSRFPDLRALTTNVVDSALEAPHSASPASDAFDLVVEIWFEGDGPAQVHRDQDGQGVVARAFDYSVTEIVEKDLASAEVPGVGVKSFVGILGLPGQNARDARARYDAHAPLALDVHIGLGRYVRHWVDRRSTPDAPRYIGISLLQFPTRADYIDRFYRDPEDMKLILADVAGFLSGVERLLATEHTHIGREDRFG